jgi:hypothetical protein
MLLLLMQELQKAAAKLALESLWWETFRVLTSW